MKQRHQIRLPIELRARVGAYAHERGIRFAPAVRALVVEGLRLAAGDSRDELRLVSTAAIAALVAAEQTALMVASILPEGEQKWLAMAERAAVRAEQRLASFESNAEAEL